MTQLFLVIISSLLLIPILYVLPKGLSLKQKMIMLGGAFFLSLGSVYAIQSQTLSYSLALLAMTGLAFIAAYVTEKRLPDVAMQKPIKATEDYIVPAVVTEEIVIEEQDMMQDIQPQEVELSPIELPALELQDVQPLESVDTPSVKEETLPVLAPEVPSVEDEFDFLKSEREGSDETDEVEQPQSIEAEITPERAEWLAEIEELESIPLVLNEVAATVEVDVLEQIPVSEELLELEDLTIVEEEAPETVVQEESAEPVLEELEEELPAEAETAVAEPEHIEIALETPEMDNDVRELLLQTLNTYQSSGDAASFQEMAQAVLDQPLHDKDYYLFANQLFQSYIAHGHQQEAQTLLMEMGYRLREYETINSEIKDYFTIFFNGKI
ncbi:hypothetical protein ACFQPF_15335 [Fictibacillus iocasae]|uniref:MFS transporter n=1 Tax=Fictibacillus iocasae TaxID=2715437 RepID=A0ABW2NUH4_9BACL